MASTSLVESERELAQLRKIYNKWKPKRRQTVKLLRDLADEIQKHEFNRRIAKLFGSSVSIVGTSLAIGGFVAAFFTGGITLIFILVGSSVAAAGGTTTAGTELVTLYLKSSTIKRVNKAIEDDIEESRKLQNQFSRVKLIYNCGILATSFGGAIFTGISTGMQLGNIANEAGEAIFQTLGTSTRLSNAGGLAFGAISLVGDIYTLVSTSVEVHRGSILPVVEDIRTVAQSLENEESNLTF